MNKLTKIGVSALAGSLALTAANAIEMSVSGSAGAAFATSDENLKGDFYQYDSVILSASGETDGGMTVSASWELDSDNPTNSSYDNRTLSFGNDSIGTFTFAGHGGTSVMGMWDDVMPTAYEEPWFGVTSPTKVDGNAGNGVFTYTSPTVGGASLTATYQQADTTEVIHQVVYKQLSGTGDKRSGPSLGR